MSKRRNNDASKGNTLPTTSTKRARNPPGFRVAHPPAAQSAPRSTAASSSSTLTNSRIRTLVVGSNGRLAGRRMDRTHHLVLPANDIPSGIDLPQDLPEDAFQATSTDVPTDSEPKPKRKRNNNTRVCVFFY